MFARSSSSVSFEEGEGNPRWGAQHHSFKVQRRRLGWPYTDLYHGVSEVTAGQTPMGFYSPKEKRRMTSAIYTVPPNRNKRTWDEATCWGTDVCHHHHHRRGLDHVYSVSARIIDGIPPWCCTQDKWRRFFLYTAFVWLRSKHTKTTTHKKIHKRPTYSTTDVRQEGSIWTAPESHWIHEPVQIQRNEVSTLILNSTSMILMLLPSKCTYQGF